jgi:stalled ribosome rescue protein Dom34
MSDDDVGLKFDQEYLDAFDNAQDEAEARIAAYKEIFRLAREKVKAAGGMKTQQQAMEEIQQESRETYVKMIDMLAHEEPFWAEYRDKLMSFDELKKHMLRYDQAIAYDIKEARMKYTNTSNYRSAKELISDEAFERVFKQDNHPHNPEVFDKLVAQLKSKGLLY